VKEDKFRGGIWIHEGLNEPTARRFWAKLTNIPTQQFYKSYIAINKTDSKKVRKNLHEYGVCAISFTDSTIHRRLMGWIQGILRA
jgi:hypothetical protein